MGRFGNRSSCIGSLSPFINLYLIIRINYSKTTVHIRLLLSFFNFKTLSLSQLSIPPIFNSLLFSSLFKLNFISPIKTPKYPQIKSLKRVLINQDLFPQPNKIDGKLEFELHSVHFHDD